MVSYEFTISDHSILLSWTCGCLVRETGSNRQQRVSTRTMLHNAPVLRRIVVQTKDTYGACLPCSLHSANKRSRLYLTVCNVCQRGSCCTTPSSTTNHWPNEGHVYVKRMARACLVRSVRQTNVAHCEYQMYQFGLFFDLWSCEDTSFGYQRSKETTARSRSELITGYHLLPSPVCIFLKRYSLASSSFSCCVLCIWVLHRPYVHVVCVWV